MVCHLETEILREFSSVFALHRTPPKFREIAGAPAPPPNFGKHFAKFWSGATSHGQGRHNGGHDWRGEDDIDNSSALRAAFTIMGAFRDDGQDASHASTQKASWEERSYQ